MLYEKRLTSFDSVFEVARGFRSFEMGNKNGDFVALFKNEAKSTCIDKA